MAVGAASLKKTSWYLNIIILLGVEEHPKWFHEKNINLSFSRNFLDFDFTKKRHKSILPSSLAPSTPRWVQIPICTSITSRTFFVDFAKVCHLAEFEPLHNLQACLRQITRVPSSYTRCDGCLREWKSWATIINFSIVDLIHAAVQLQSKQHHYYFSTSTPYFCSAELRWYNTQWGFYRY